MTDHGTTSGDFGVTPQSGTPDAPRLSRRKFLGSIGGAAAVAAGGGGMLALSPVLARPASAQEPPAGLAVRLARGSGAAVGLMGQNGISWVKMAVNGKSQ